jgi:5-(aminomethyl)-3-furanmethanol phosphate kinase
MIRVVKVGGSLLDWPLLPQALARWLAGQQPAANVLLCGGGALADCVRLADRHFQLGEEAAHWLAVDCLSITARLLAAFTTDSVMVSSYRELLAELKAAGPMTMVFNPHEFLREQEAKLPGRVLPHDWTATSDSIAARLAEVVCAGELVLLKSTDRQAGSLQELAAAGHVDQHFPLACGSIKQVRLVNLRRMEGTLA